MEWEPRGRFQTSSDAVVAPASGRLRETQRVVVRYPLTVTACPLIVFSHSLANQADNYAELSTLWASRGFVVMHPTHADSIAEIARARPDWGLDSNDQTLSWRGTPESEWRMVRLVYDTEHWQARVEDVRLVLDNAPRIAREAGFGGEVDLDRAGIGGHSYGTFTAAQIAGMVVHIPGKGRTSLKDPRFKAALVLSSPGPDEDRGMDEHSWDAIDVPLMCLNGTDDFGIDPAKHGAAWRRQSFDRSPVGGKYLVFLHGVDHGFGGISRVGRGYFRDWGPTRRDVATITSAYWESTLHGSAEAREWLRSQVGVQAHWTLEMR